MWPNLRTVSDPGKVWRRTNSSGKRFEVPEIDAVSRVSSFRGFRISWNTGFVCGVCWERADKYGRGVKKPTKHENNNDSTRSSIQERVWPEHREEWIDTAACRYKINEEKKQSFWSATQNTTVNAEVYALHSPRLTARDTGMNLTDNCSQTLSQAV